VTGEGAPVRPCPPYETIRAFVKKKYGFAVETCWIADVKQSLG